jgi:GntR family histidine utilization transcriptional repressor
MAAMPQTILPKQPAYEQVKTFIKTQITQGVWRPGDAVPSEAALQLQFSVSRMTVNRAVKELAVEGLVTRVQGSGTVVAQLHRISSTLAFRDIRDEIQTRGHAHSTQVLKVGAIRADAALADIFKLPVGAKLFHSLLVHLEDGVPIQFEDRHVNPASAPDYLGVDFTTITPTHYLLEHAPLTEARYAIEACLPRPPEAKALGLKKSEPCLVLTRSTISGLQVASLARQVYPGARYRFHGQFEV